MYWSLINTLSFECIHLEHHESSVSVNKEKKNSHNNELVQELKIWLSLVPVVVINSYVKVNVKRFIKSVY